MNFKQVMIPVLLFSCVTLSGCVGTVVGAATDVAIEVAKVPFKVVGAAVDVVASKDKDEK